jgi:hypothetical protein
MVRTYDEEAHTLWPRLVAQISVVSMLDTGVRDKLLPIYADIETLDVKVGEAIFLAKTDLSAGLRRIEACHDEALKLASLLLNQCTNLLQEPVRLTP